MKVEILQPMKEGREDSFFYDNDIAKIVGKQGVYFLTAAGDIDIEILDANGEWYRYDSYHVQDAIEKYKLTDKELERLLDEDKIKWNMNNWFEVYFVAHGADASYDDGNLGDVDYDYSTGIRTLEQYAKDMEAELDTRKH